MIGTDLPFEYTTRASMFAGTPEQVQSALIDERDRQLEDYLMSLHATIADLTARIEDLESP